MKEEPTINYAFALKQYNQNGRGRSMKKFCEEEGYDYEKFMQYSRRGQKDSASSRRPTSVSLRKSGCVQTKKNTKNIIDKTAGNQRLTIVCEKVCVQINVDA